MTNSENWTLAMLVLIGLGAFLLLVAAGWLALRRRAFWAVVRLPYMLLALAAASTVTYLRAPTVTARHYLMAVALAAIVASLIHLVISLSFSLVFSRRREIQYPPLLRNVILGLIYIGILLLCMKTFEPSFSLTPFLVTSGVLSLVIGLALQDILGNFFAGVVLTIEKPFRIDDWVRSGEIFGKVVGITWRTTKIRTRDNDSLIVPNRHIAGAELTNYSFPWSLHRARVQIGLPYATLPDMAEQALLEAVERVEGVRKRPAPEVFVLDFGDSAIHYELAYWIDDYDTAYVIKSNVRREIFHSLKRYGISVPFPIRDVYTREGKLPEQVWKEDHRFQLRVIAGPAKGLVRALRASETVIGRGADCAVELPDPSISKQHARLTMVDGGYVVEDLDSRHGTRVNGQPINDRRLRSGDEIAVGNSLLRLEEIVIT